MMLYLFFLNKIETNQSSFSILFYSRFRWFYYIIIIIIWWSLAAYISKIIILYNIIYYLTIVQQAPTPLPSTVNIHCDQSNWINRVIACISTHQLLHVCLCVNLCLFFQCIVQFQWIFFDSIWIDNNSSSNISPTPTLFIWSDPLHQSPF